MFTRFLKSGKLFLVTALCFLLVGITLIIPVKVSASEITNGILLLKVQDNPEETNYASFMLSKADDKSTLTYSQFFSSYTTVNINGVSYQYSDGKVVTPAYVANDNSVVTVQDFNGVEITQRLLLTTGNSSKEDMLLIHYSAKNTTTSNVLISIKTVIDPTLSKKETDMIQFNGIEYNVEKNFIDQQISDDWCIKDSDNKNIVAYGILDIGLDMPNKFQIADWKNLYDCKGVYLTKNDSTIEDNAVAVIWENRTLVANEKIDLGTKYGLYSEEDVIPTAPTPTEKPTEVPTVPTPTEKPTEAPTVPTPTEKPTKAPVETKPTEKPTKAPIKTEPTKKAESTTNATAQGTTQPFVNPDTYAPKTGDSLKMFGAVVMFMASGLCIILYGKKRREM